MEKSTDGPKPSKIQHQHPTFAPKPEEQARPPAEIDIDDPLPVAKSVGPPGAVKTIRAFGDSQRHEEQWQRTPNTTGSGAIHVRTFHSKLTDDALKYMDQVINEWLDANPQYEVKFVNSTVGILTGKLKEPHLVCQVWV
ncbi:MAG: hypothetical protein ACYS0D_16205 [Planctomycetota bacterium]|jgi:hypothetical protein